MQILKAFYKNTLREAPNIIMYFGVFLVLILLMTGSGERQRKSVFQSSKMDIVVKDEDHSVFSEGLVNYLKKNHNIIATTFNTKTITDDIFYGDVDYVVTIPAGFAKNVASGKTKNLVTSLNIPKSTTTYFIDTQVNEYIHYLQNYKTVLSDASDKNIVTMANKNVAKKANVTFRDNKNANNKSTNIFYFFEYLPYILICIMTVTLGTVLANFRVKDVCARIECSALSMTKRNFFLCVGSVAFALTVWLLFIAVASIFFPGDVFSTKGAMYLINSFVFLLICLSITFLVSFITNSGMMLNLLSNLIGLGLSFLGGIFVPMEYMSKSVVTVGKFLPSYWYVKALRVGLLYDGSHLAQMHFAQYLGIEFLFAVAIMALALVVSRTKAQA